MAEGAKRLASVQLPLALHPLGSAPVADGIALLEDDAGTGTVFVWGQAAWTWTAADPAARRLAAVQLVIADAARQRAVATAFGVDETTVWRWRSDYEQGGSGALAPQAKGPKRPSKLTADKRGEIVALRATGLSLKKVAAASGVSTDTVRRAIATPAPRPPAPPDASLVPLAAPAKRHEERQAARRGELCEAPPVLTEGAFLPFVGALAVLPALAATGLLEAAASVYGVGRQVHGVARSAFYGLRSLVLCVVFACLLGEPRAEGLTRIPPEAMGRLIGLDRAPEVKRLRARIAELAGEHKADELVEALARRHIEAHPAAVGLLYLDGHVRAYHGKAEIPKAHVTRMRISMPAEVDTWLSDRFGDGLLVWQAEPGASLAGELARVLGKVRVLVGDDARPTICFDRGAWSPKLFAKVEQAGFHVLTYRKKPAPTEPRSAFSEVVFCDDGGRRHTYLLADRAIRVSYDNKRRRLSLRQITRLDAKTGHQTQVVTTRRDADAGLLAHAMFSRWRQENFFRYQRAHYGLDALDCYATTADDPARLVPNPARRDADRAVQEARRALTTAEAAAVRQALEAGSATTDDVRAARDVLARRKEEASALPAKVPLGEVHPTAVRLDVERKRIMDAIRMATYNAESALARLVAPHYARAEDEARALLHEIFRSAGDLEVEGDRLHVRLHALSAPRRTRALAGLCEELTATETRYPGTDLVLVYSVRDA